MCERERKSLRKIKIKKSACVREKGREGHRKCKREFERERMCVCEREGERSKER